MREFNKLVRDKIPEIIKGNGEVAVCRTLENDEYIKELNTKLKEEVFEYLEDNNVEELADIYEVMLAILKFKNVEVQEFENIRKSKSDKRESFDKKIFLEKTYKLVEEI